MTGTLVILRHGESTWNQLNLFTGWHDVVAPQLLGGQNVLITAHGNSLRALVMHLEDVSANDIAELNIPTGAPRRYEFDSALQVTSAQYLGDAEAVAAAAAKVAAQAGG